MSIWAQLQTLPEEAQQQVHLAYGEHFPIEVRCALADWIEEKPWKELDLSNVQHEQYARNLVSALIKEIEAKANAEQDFVLKFRLSETAQHFQLNYTNNPLVLVRIVKHCLNTESKVIEHSQNYLNISNNETKPQIQDPQQEMSQQMVKLKKETIETGEELRQMQEEQEQFIIQYQEKQKRQNIMNCQQNQTIELINKWNREKEALDTAINQKARQLFQMRTALIGRYAQTLSALQALQQRVLDKQLVDWLRGQQLEGNGVPFDNNLDQIQKWCEGLAEVNWHNRQTMKRMVNMCQQLPLGNSGSGGGHIEQLQAFSKQLTGLLYSLVRKTFVIEKQPPQVMKTMTRFQSTVRLLVGDKLNVHMTAPIVRATIISEAQASALLKNPDNMVVESTGNEILNSSAPMEYERATRELAVHFRNMQLKKIKRSDRKGTESVKEEKFALLFRSQFSVGGGELVFQVWTLSLPIVVIVHASQEAASWATITWDNAFAAPGRTPFAVPDKVPFSQIGDVLSQKFKSYIGGRGLTDDNLRFLAEKAFRGNGLKDYNNQLLSRTLFHKEMLPDRDFTFWEWFYSILKVTKDHLRGAWNDGSVIGFVAKQQTEELLSHKTFGTFILRFSDSQLGGVTAAWVGEGKDGAPETYMVQPFVDKDFRIRSLADRINDLKQLSYLYPNIPKDQAFSKYYTPFQEQQQPSSAYPYVPICLVTTIPGLSSSFGSTDSFPHSPQHIPNSPPGSVGYYDSQSVQSIDSNTNAVEDMDDYEELMHLNLDPPALGLTQVHDLMFYDKPV